MARDNYSAMHELQLCEGVRKRQEENLLIFANLDDAQTERGLL
jgi:hypothetical protein